MLMRDWMVSPVHTVHGGAPLGACAEAMQQRGIRHLPVVDADGKLTGLLTDFEFRLRGVFVSGMWVPHDDNDRWLLARDVARTPDVTVAPDTELAEALKQLGHAYQDCAIVLSDAHPVGILTEHDVVRRALDLLPEDAGVERVSRVDLPLLRSDQSATEARSYMAKHRLRHALVVEDGILVGVVSYRDVALEEAIDTLELEDVAKEPMKHTGPLSAREAAQILYDRKIGCLPLVDDEDRPVALVTRREILAAVRELLPG